MPLISATAEVRLAPINTDQLFAYVANDPAALDRHLGKQ